jgi:hypothetical protein
MIDISSFRKAIHSLERGLARAEMAPLDEELRDRAIQRFEYTYELAWKSLPSSSKPASRCQTTPPLVWLFNSHRYWWCRKLKDASFDEPITL